MTDKNTSKEPWCLSFDNKAYHLLKYGEVALLRHKPLCLFYDHNNQSHIAIAKALPYTTKIIALVKKDNPSTMLPYKATTLIYCDDGHTTSQAIYHSLVLYGKAKLDFKDWEQILMGRVYHYCLTANGTQKAKSIGEDIAAYLTNLATPIQSCCMIIHCHEQSFSLNEIIAIENNLSPFLDLENEEKPIFWGFYTNTTQQDALIIDFFCQLPNELPQ